MTERDAAANDGGTRADLACERLEAAILSGELQPGDRLNEPDLSRRFGISRGPLREAILRLEGRKLVRRIAHMGSTVVDLSADDLREIFELREVLEGLACRLATEAMSDRELDAIEAILTRVEAEVAAAKDDSRHISGAGDPDFHASIIRGSGNQRLIDTLLGETYPLMQVYRFRSQRSPGRLRRALVEHAAIMAAMRARDGVEAERLMRLHIRSARINLINEERRAPEASLRLVSTS
ncbi:GntR family transcriptional regulator [Methylobacterium aquaticum]|uniref:GntR family transcriptional regulator n=1 Tax=Methylobacterium aquaticum TaxID=270351 RepID=UPI003D16F02D